MADPRHAPLSFRPPPRVVRDEEFDEGLFERAALARDIPDEEPEGEEPPAVREGLPASYRMRHDAHYVDQIASRRHAEPVHIVPIGEIDGPHPVGGPNELEPLARSVKKHGILQPLLVRRQNGRFHLIAGTRRLAAAVAAGLTEVPCLVHTADDERARVLAEAASLIARPAASPVRQLEIPAVVFADLTERLGAISACLQLFGERDRPLRERVALGLVQSEVQRAGWLSQALAVLAAEPAVVSNPVDLAGIAGRLVGTLAPERVLAGVEFDVECGPGAHMVRGDEQLLSIAMAGLVMGIHGLVERLDDARVRLSVTTDPETGVVRFEASQETLSIPTAWRARFFDPSWTDRPGGASVAVALAAARRVAVLHGGEVQLVGGRREGCALILTLPAES